MSVIPKAWVWARDILLALLGLGQFHLYAVDTIHTVDKKDQYENEGNLLSCKPP